MPSRKWPGGANLEVAHVWVRRNGWNGPFVLEDQPVNGITAFLTKPGTVTGKPYRLAANQGKSFQGSIVLGMGFVLEPEEAESLIASNPRNKDVVFPYLNGQDLNSSPDQSPSRWVINFRDWPLNRGADGRWAEATPKQRTEWIRSGVVPADYLEAVATDYPDCLSIVEKEVKPERSRNNRKVYRDRWWQFAEKRPDLYATIAGMERVLVRSRVADLHSLVFVPTNLVLNERLAVFVFAEAAVFAILQSSIHEAWARKYSSTLRRDMMYSPSDCFETFPFPEDPSGIEKLGEFYQEHRKSSMTRNQQGLTNTYNHFHDPNERSQDVRLLRELHIEMDQAVAATYGWRNLDLGHDFHETTQGSRYTLSEPARREVLDRLLALNHERYEEEVRQGLHEKKRNRKATTASREKKIETIAHPLLDNL